MRWFESMIRRRRIRRNLCPEGHGPLKTWAGQPRCWTCGWTPACGVDGHGPVRVHEGEGDTTK